MLFWKVNNVMWRKSIYSFWGAVYWCRINDNNKRVVFETLSRIRLITLVNWIWSETRFLFSVFIFCSRFLGIREKGYAGGCRLSHAIRMQSRILCIYYVHWHIHAKTLVYPRNDQYNIFCLCLVFNSQYFDKRSSRLHTTQSSRANLKSYHIDLTAFT